jgi:hypothetical protein
MPTKILLWFDVEDYVTAQADDASRKSSTCWTARRAGDRQVCHKEAETQQHPENSIFYACCQIHEMAFHSTEHSVHPMPSEYLNGYGFAAGACRI